MIEKNRFHKAVLDMQDKPNNLGVQKEYVKQFNKLCEIILHKCRVDYNDHEDRKQDLLEMAFKKGLHDKIIEDGDSFSFYYITLQRAVWRQQAKLRKRVDYIQKNGIYPKMYTDNEVNKTAMLKDLGFKLEDFSFDETDHIPSLEDLPKVKVKTVKNKRKAKHWEEMFKTLQENRTMTEFGLANLLSAKKKESLKDVAKSIHHNMKEIARREGYKLSVTDSGVDKVYILLGGD